MPTLMVPWQESLFFKDSPPGILERLKRHLVERRFEPEETIFREGEIADCLFILKSGEVELVHSLPTRPDVTARIRLVHPGDVFAWSSLVGQQELTATAVSLEESEAYTLSTERLRSLMDTEPRFGYQVMDRLANVIAGRLHDTRRQLQWLNSF